MPKTIFRTDALAELNHRLSRLSPDSQRHWGKMTAPQMICHLQDSLECATGLKTAKPRKTGMDNPLLRWLIIYAAPWPKGKTPTAPEMLETQPADWAADVQRLRELLSSAAALGPKGKWGRHPAFGEMKGTHYGHLIYKHFNHHLTQFGV